MEINYKDFDNTEKTTESNVTPKLKLTAIKAEERIHVRPDQREVSQGPGGPCTLRRILQ